MTESESNEAIANLRKVMGTRKGKGYLVLTKNGLMGRTYNEDEPVNGKQVVHTLNGKMLCDPVTVKVKGFID